MMSDRMTARLDEFIVEMESINDTRENAIVKYEFPYRPGAQLENLGEKARTTEFRCYFIGDAYEDHFYFLEHVSIDKVFELQHPVYGLLKGKIDSVKISHTGETERTAIIDIVFVQEGAQDVHPQPFGDIGAQSEAGYQASQEQHLHEIAADFIAADGAEGREIVSRTIDPAQTLISQFTDVSLQARALLSVIDDAVSRAETVASSVLVPVDSIVSIIEYPSTLPGKISRAFGRTCARYAETLAEIKDSPRQYISNLKSGLSDMSGQYSDAQFPMQKNFRIAAAQMLNMQTGLRYAEDDDRRMDLARLEATESFDMAGRYLNPPAVPAVMSVTDLEETLAAVRLFTQNAIAVESSPGRYADIARGMSELKAMCLALLRHVNAIKIQWEKITVKQYDVAMPLHLICLREGLDYRRADRILALNQAIKNPSFSAGGISVYAV